jgi:hypothetical protein
MSQLMKNKSQHRALIGGGLILLISLLTRTLGLETFIAGDEYYQLHAADKFFTSLLKGDLEHLVVLLYPGVPSLIFQGLGIILRYAMYLTGWFPLGASAGSLVFAMEHAHEDIMNYFPYARFMMGLAASLSIVLIYYLLKRLLGGRLGFLSALVIALDPFFIAHSRILHVDAPLTFFMIISFLALLLYLEEEKKRWLVVSAVAGALAVLSKIAGIALIVILVATLIVYPLLRYYPDEKKRRRTYGLYSKVLIVWLVISAMAFFMLFPNMWKQPLSSLGLLAANLASILTAKAHPKSGDFWGLTDADKSPLYYILTFPFHLTPFTTIGLILGIVFVVSIMTVWIRRRAIITDRFSRILLSLSLFSAMFMAAVSITPRRIDRYLLPIFPAIDIISVMAVWLLLKYFKQAKARQWVLGGAAALFLFSSAQVVAAYPYYLAYFNPLVGGGNVAQQFLVIGWGEGFDKAAQYLDGKPEAQTLKVASWYSRQFSPFFKGTTVDLASNKPALEADYTVFYINQVQRSYPTKELLAYFAERQPEHVVNLLGLDYAWIYPGPLVSKKKPQDVGSARDDAFGKAIKLLGIRLDQASLPADGDLYVILTWHAVSDAEADYNVYIKVKDQHGSVWGQVDRLPLGGVLRTDKWTPGAFIRDEYRLRLQPGTPPGDYTLEVGMYRFDNGQVLGVAPAVAGVTVTAPSGPADASLPEKTTGLSWSPTPELNLLGYRLEDVRLKPGEETMLRLYWQPKQALKSGYELDWRLVNAAGAEAYRATEKMNEVLSTGKWPAGHILAQPLLLHNLGSIPAGDYKLEASLRRLNDPWQSEWKPLTSLTLEDRPRNYALPQPQTSAAADFGGQVKLLGYDLKNESWTPKSEQKIKLYWQAQDIAETNNKIFLHLVDKAGNIVSQHDSEPGNGAFPTSGWRKGEIITDEHVLPLPEQLPAGEYTLLIGWYDPASNQRLKTASPAGGETDAYPLLTFSAPRAGL